MIEEAIVVAIVLVAVGAAVLVLEPVHVLRDVGASIVIVVEAVAIVVGLGAAVLVLEVVAILRLVGAPIDVVLQAVAIAITEAWLEHDADERARRGIGALGRHEPASGADRQDELRARYNLGSRRSPEGW